MHRRAVLLPLALACLASLPAGASAQPVPTPVPMRWEGLERRNPGLVVFRSRWDAGTLELKDDLVRWADRKNPGKNLVLPVRRLTGHALLCPGAAGAPCTEWRVSTRTETYAFRAAGGGDGAALRRIFDALRAAYSDLPAEETR